jgi:hypothetical protein
MDVDKGAEGSDRQSAAGGMEIPLEVRLENLWSGQSKLCRDVLELRDALWNDGGVT